MPAGAVAAGVAGAEPYSNCEKSAII